MALMDEVLGALLIGAFINCSMYALELVCLYFYFGKQNKDRIVLRAVIIFMLCCDTANTILQCVTVYLMAVTHYGDATYLAKGTVFFALQCALPSTTALICQLFLVWRFFRVSKNYFISAFLCLPPLGAWISAIYATVALVVYTSLEDRLRVVQIGTAWLTLEAASDITIALALVILLGRYTRKTTFVETQSLLKRLMFNAAQTGTITASIAVGMLMAFLLSKTTNINTGFSYVLGREYALTLMLNLLSRAASESGVTVVTGQISSHSGNKFGLGTFKLGQANGGGTVGVNTQTPVTRVGPFDGQIDVNRETTFHIDRELADEKGDFRHARRDSSSEQFELNKMSPGRGF